MELVLPLPGRLLLCQRIEAGWPVAHAAESIGISRDRVDVWWRRYQMEGVAGLEDRSAAPGPHGALDGGATSGYAFVHSDVDASSEVLTDE